MDGGEIVNINRQVESNFSMVRAFNFAKTVFNDHGFSKINDRAALDTKLDEAIASMAQ
jgi:hypothetical protein